MADDGARLDPDFSMTTPWRRELGELGPLLQRWARERVGLDAEVSAASAPDNGLSSETALFEMRVNGVNERYAARLAPTPDVYPVFQEYDLELQRKCMDLVRAHTDVPAPEVRWLELDPQWLGAQFLVMRRIDGESPPDLPPYVFAATDQLKLELRRAGEDRRKLDVRGQVDGAHGPPACPRLRDSDQPSRSQPDARHGDHAYPRGRVERREGPHGRRAELDASNHGVGQDDVTGRRRKDVGCQQYPRASEPRHHHCQ